MYKNFNKRQLHERSFLSFEFPRPNGKITKAYIPFLENCEVSESQKANLAEYSLLARSGSIFSYLGAKSRTINLTFKITLQHVVDMLGLEGINDRFKILVTAGKEDDKKSLFFQSNSKSSNNLNFNYMDHATLHKNYYKSWLPNTSEFENNNKYNLNVANGVLNVLGIPGQLRTNINSDEASIVENNKTLNLIMFWINLVRSSVVNNSKNTVYGCPIVRLTHGTMYNNIPCIVDNYNIKINQEVGYEVESLTPKQFEISMNLMEQRVGDFGEFKSTDVIKGDNITGWESVIEENNMDPYNGIISTMFPRAFT